MQKPFIIGICGGSGSGKTSIIKKIRESFSEKDVCLISQDDYYKTRDKQKIDENGIKNFDLPSSIRIEEFVSDVKKLLNGEDLILKEYTFNNSLAEEKTISIKPAPIIIVEGLFVFYIEKLREMMDLKVYIAASDVVKVKRRILRDQLERNYPLDDVLYRYEKHVMPAYNQYIFPYKKESDIIINNEFSYHGAVDVVVGFIREKLRNINSSVR